MNAQINPIEIGGEAYLQDGRVCRVLGRIDSRYVVEVGYEVEGETFFENDAIVVKRVFATEPVVAIGAEVKRLGEEETRLRDALRKLRQEVAEAEAVHRQRLEHLKKMPGLERLEQFIAGEITHYVIQTYSGVDILPFPDARSSSESSDVWNGTTYEKPLRMLQLFGDPKSRTVEWHLNQYSGGTSRDSGACYPCLSLDEARAKATELLDAKVAELMQSTGYMHGGNYLIASAKRLDLPLPEAFLARWNEYEARSRAERIAKAEAELAQLKAGS